MIVTGIVSIKHTFTLTKKGYANHTAHVMDLTSTPIGVNSVKVHKVLGLHSGLNERLDLVLTRDS